MCTHASHGVVAPNAENKSILFSGRRLNFIDFIMGLPSVSDGASGHCLNAILSIVDAFSGMV